MLLAVFWGHGCHEYQIPVIALKTGEMMYAHTNLKVLDA
jgi:uncharacterized protein (DUF486 family)